MRQAPWLSACEGVVLAAALRLLAWPAVEQGVFLGSSQKVLEADHLPEREAFGTSPTAPRPGGTSDSPSKATLPFETRVV